MGRAAGFEWWAPHDHVVRRVRALFAVAVGVLAAYVFALLGIVVAILYGAQLADRLPVGAIVVAAIALHAALASAIALIAGTGLGLRVRVCADARTPSSDAPKDLRQFIDDFALARGVPAPRLWMVGQGAPNAIAWGRRRNSNIALTTGALGLAPKELHALCAYETIAVTSRPFTRAAATADVVLFTEWFTNVVWLCAAATLISPIVGAPPAVAATGALAIIALVAITRPFFVIADRAIPRLLADVSELVDLEMVRCTAEPAALAGLLLDLLGDQQRVTTPWRIAHRWFERDVLDVPVEPRSSVYRARRTSARSLLERARVAVELADGEPHLQDRLARAEAQVG